MLAERLAGQPPEMAPWPALRATFELIAEQSRWQDLLAPNLLDRVDTAVPAELRAPTAVEAAGDAVGQPAQPLLNAARETA